MDGGPLAELFLLIALLFAVLTSLGFSNFYSSFFLALSFVSASIFLMLAGSAFVGLATILVYVGAVLVLFVFIIMMFGARGGSTRSFLPLYLLPFLFAPFVYDYFQAWDMPLTPRVFSAADLGQFLFLDSPGAIISFEALSLYILLMIISSFMILRQK